MMFGLIMEVSGFGLALVRFLSHVCCGTDPIMQTASCVFSYCCSVTAFLVWLIMASFARFSHAGMVVSGKFLTTGSEALYLIAVGSFLKVFLLCTYVILAASVLLTIAFSIKKKTMNEEKW